MDDLISRQAALDVLEWKWAGKAAFDAIKSLPTAEPKWTPCSERLPDITDHHTSEPCIVYCDNGAYTFAELEENIFGQVGWNCERDDEYHEAVGVVLAWMPLPEPFKEESDETD